MWTIWQISSVSVLIGCIGLSTGCATPPPCLPADTMQASAPKAPVTMTEPLPVLPQSPPSLPSATLALERKIKMQEKRIADLSEQLQLLKRIELERHKQ